MAKRTRIKGRGAAIFLGDDEVNPPQNIPRPSSPKTNKVGKATFYLPQRLLDDLEDAWLSLRKTHKGRRVAKSEIVRIALETLIDDWKERSASSTLTQALAE
jgi:hypothetical protein